MLVVSDLDALLDAAGSAHRLAADQRTTLDDARTALDAADTEQGWERVIPPEHADLTAGVSAVLAEVCAALSEANVGAEPFEGLGVTFGGEVLSGQVVVIDPCGLYERMFAGPSV